MRTAPALVATRGLNTKVDPVRLPAGENGSVWLSSCQNVDIDDTGRVSRRKGFTLAQAGSWHSLFPCSGYMLGVKSNGLYCINGATSVGIRNVTAGNRMSYAKGFDGRNEIVYYMNGAESGKVYGGISYTIGRTEYVGPASSRQFSDPPIGEHVCIWNGRMYVSTREALWYSEPFNFETFDLARSFAMFNSRITMLIPITAGLMVGTAKNIVMLSGPTPTEWGYRELAQYGAIEWTEQKATEQLSVGNNLAQNTWLFGTQNGICLLTDEGQFMNLTEDKISYPSAIRGSAGIFNGKYVLNLEG